MISIRRKQVVHLVRDIEYVGGVEIFLASYLRQAQGRHHILICTEGTSGGRAASLRSAGVPVHLVSGSFRNKLKTIQSFVDSEDQPILHAHLFRPEVLAWHIRGVGHRITTKYCNYALDSQGATGALGKVRKGIFDYVVDPLLGFTYDDIIVINNELERKWGRLSGSVTKILVSHIEHFADYRPPRYATKDLQVLFAPRMVKEKRHDLFLTALKEIKYSKAIILGDGPARSSIELGIARLGLRNVELPGAVASSRVLEYMDWADVMLLTSATEGLPLLIQEAMSRGLPVVASDVGGNRELLGGGGGVLVDSADPCDFAAATNSLLGEDLGAIGNEGIRAARERFSLRLTIQEMERLYERAD